jgi:sugar phosphate isomerase/epimerase
MLERAREKVFLYQLCNVVEPDPARKPDRTLFTDGALDVGEMVCTIRGHGYDGFLEFELFPPHLHGRDPNDVIRAAVEQYKAFSNASIA